jgi:hypothetical protein
MDVLPDYEFVPKNRYDCRKRFPAQARTGNPRSVSSRLDGSGTADDAIVIVPGDELKVMLFPKLSDKFVTGNAVKSTGLGPGVSPPATSKKTCPSPTDIPEPITAPIFAVSKKSDASIVCPGAEVLIVGPNNEWPLNT